MENDGPDIDRLVLNHLNVVIVLFAEFFQELVDELVLAVDDLLENVLVGFNGLVQLLALLDFLDFRPLEFKGCVFFARLNCLTLNLVVSFHTSQLLKLSRVLLLLFVIESDRLDLFAGSSDGVVHVSSTLLHLQLAFVHLFIVHLN